MKVIIAGGRNYEMTDTDWWYLDTIDITEVVSGGATGADKGGEEYANAEFIPIKLFPANWEKYGKAAGPIRNREMVEYADAVVLFPGGRGTDDMFNAAKDAGIIIYDKR
jgi:hypothetical protein